MRTTFKSKETLREALVQTKDPQPEWKKKGVIYLVPCAKCESVYIGETGRTLKKKISEHKGAVKRHDVKNGIAWTKQHKVLFLVRTDHSFFPSRLSPELCCFFSVCKLVLTYTLHIQLKSCTSICNGKPPIVTVEEH